MARRQATAAPRRAVAKAKTPRQKQKQHQNVNVSVRTGSGSGNAEASYRPPQIVQVESRYEPQSFGHGDANNALQAYEATREARAEQLAERRELSEHIYTRGLMHAGVSAAIASLPHLVKWGASAFKAYGPVQTPAVTARTNAQAAVVAQASTQLPRAMRWASSAFGPFAAGGSAPATPDLRGGASPNLASASSMPSVNRPITNIPAGSVGPPPAQAENLSRERARQTAVDMLMRDAERGARERVRPRKGPGPSTD